MGTHVTKSAISRRAYAKRRRVSEAAIRKRITDGTLAPALTRDGRIKPDVADRLLAAATTSGETTPSSLVEARRRKAAAGIALLRDEVDALGTGHAPRKLVEEAWRRISFAAARCLFGIGATVAARIAGKSPAAAGAIIDQAARQALNEIAGTQIAPLASVAKVAPVNQVPLEEMTPVQLATTRADLLARHLETRRAITRGTLADLAAWERDGVARIVTIQRLVLALPSKIGPHAAGSDAPKLAGLLDREIGAILHHLVRPGVVTHADLLAKARRA